MDPRLARRLTPTAREVEFFAPRGTAADEDRVEALFEQRTEARDGRVVPDIDTHVEDHLRLLVEHLRGEAERRDVRPHQPAGFVMLLEDRDGVPEWQEVVRHGERGRAGSDAGDPLPVLFFRHARQAIGDVAAQVRCDSLQSADGDGGPIHPLAPTGGLARSVAGAPEDRGEDVRLPVDHVGVVVATLGDQADVLGNVRMRRTRPLAVHYLVVVARILDVRWFHVSPLQIVFVFACD